jgi:hypothetical protein
MRHISFVFTLLVLPLALAWPASGADDKASTGKDPWDKFLTSGKPVTGKLVTVNGTEKSFTLEVTQQTRQINAGAQRHALELQKALADAQGIRNPADRLRRIQELNIEVDKNNRNLYTTHEEKHKFDLQTVDEVKVRQVQPPALFDDNGKRRKATAKELREMKGPGNLTGYKAEFDDLKPNQTVDVYFAKKKDPARTAKSKSKDGDADGSGDKPRVTMIVIQKEAPVR